MNRGSSRGRGALLAAALAVLAVAAPVTSAAAQGPKGPARALRQVKALTQQLATLAGTASSLQARLEAFEAKKPPAFPTAVAPTGPAGGVLSGSYPNPLLAPGSVGSANLAAASVLSPQIAEGTILSTDVADHTIGSLDLASQLVGAGQLGEVVVADGSETFVQHETTVTVNATCPADTQLIGGFAHWVPAGGFPLSSFKVSTVKSVPSETSPASQWEVTGRANDSLQTCSPINPFCEPGPTDARPRLRAKALCLSA